MSVETSNILSNTRWQNAQQNQNTDNKNKQKHILTAMIFIKMNYNGTLV